jgi:hypothetical protein
MAVTTLTREVTLKIIECGSCGTPFALPETLWNKCYNEGGFFSCPLGHSRGWTEANCKTALDKLRDENARLQSNLAYKDTQIEAERRQKIAAKGQLTKERNRTKNGVCPCCQRSFANLHRHITAKHPDYATEGAE